MLTSDKVTLEAGVPRDACRPEEAASKTANRLRLRPYQAEVIARIDAEIASGVRRILVVAPTGAGKTVIAAAFIAATLRKPSTDGA